MAAAFSGKAGVTAAAVVMQARRTKKAHSAVCSAWISIACRRPLCWASCSSVRPTRPSSTSNLPPSSTGSCSMKIATERTRLCKQPYRCARECCATCYTVNLSTVAASVPAAAAARAATAACLLCYHVLPAEERKQDLELLEAAPPDDDGGGGTSRALIPNARDADDADAGASSDDSSEVSRHKQRQL